MFFVSRIIPCTRVHSHIPEKDLEKIQSRRLPAG